MAFFFKDSDGIIRKVDPEHKPQHGQITYPYRPNEYDVRYTCDQEFCSGKEKFNQFGKYHDHTLGRVLAKNEHLARKKFESTKTAPVPDKFLRFEKVAVTNPDRLQKDILREQQEFREMDSKFTSKDEGRKVLSGVRGHRDDKSEIREGDEIKHHLKAITKGDYKPKNQTEADLIDKLLDKAIDEQKRKEQPFG